MRYTPGPRLVNANGSPVCVVGPSLDGGMREIVGMFIGERRLANAILDSAAPDLLESCELMLGYGPGKMPDGRDTYDVMRAAVAKAKGE